MPCHQENPHEHWQNRAEKHKQGEKFRVTKQHECGGKKKKKKKKRAAEPGREDQKKSEQTRNRSINGWGGLQEEHGQPDLVVD